MIIPQKEDMRHMGQGAYTDEINVYKFFNGYPERHPDIEVEALRRVLDIKGTQKFVHYDDQERVLVTQLAQGHLLNEHSPEFFTGNLTYTSGQLEDFFRTLVTMRKREVVFEAHARNLLYDSTVGFTPVDYATSTKASIDLSGLLAILSLKNIPVQGSIPGVYMPLDGLHRENHLDVKKMVFDAYRAVDPKSAAIDIEDYEETQRMVRNLSEQLSGRLSNGGYNTSLIEEDKLLSNFS